MRSIVNLIVGVVAVLAFALPFSAAVSAGWRTAGKLITPIGAAMGFLLFSSIVARAHPHATAAESVPDGTVWLLLGAGLAAGVGYLARCGRGANLYCTPAPDHRCTHAGRSPKHSTAKPR